ncbi:MAG: bifunctional 4-hydroxy-2-oxoglutarate aldolase/2-dehydro-3-deoxy-phosphogluconate aldolase [Candidatus Omnitrophica bacterium]|nr:bifunctional 4-hydroxy-2-oxoglutarate aldolase/2-dehydro-3-deoxy-phosphogluconate aldolase [Candidatus Omnitrophota bacterium]
MDVERFKKLPVMGIIRGVGLDVIEPLVKTIISSGLKTVEITMNTSGAPKLIKQMVESAKNDLTIGAGTVLTMDELLSAFDSGASFIVLPTLVKDVVKYCVKNKIPVFPGALTPQEIYTAWSEGATMVKVFPAKFFGPEYIKEVKAPFQDIQILACGGVKPENIRSYFSCGASAVAFGASIFKKEWLAGGDFSKIEEQIRSLLSEIGDRHFFEE